MPGSNIAIAVFFIVPAIAQCVHSLQYSDLETLGITCTNLEQRYRCAGSRSLLEPVERGCECDSACNAYGDCCINAPNRDTPPTPSIRDRMTCLQVGPNVEGGVYAISTCPSNWGGATQIRRKCVGPLDLSDPLNAAPVTNETQGVTYRNRYCAECNGADMERLKTFQLKMSCAESEFLTYEQIYADLRYDSAQGVWGIDRTNSQNTTEFHRCVIIFDVPDYIRNRTRFCVPNLISGCPRNYPRRRIKRACKNYTAVAYGPHGENYRNPHCALCNDRTVNEVSCGSVLLSRGRPMSFALLLDVNPSDGDQVGMRPVPTPECPSNQIYDPYKKSCRKLVCALPGWNSSRNATDFLTCRIFFDVPGYLNNVRFCKSNLISSCPPDYPRHRIRRACSEYMAAVYDDTRNYRNPHCAICNERTVGDLTCAYEAVDGRKRPMSFALLLDVNMSDGDQVGMTRVVTPQCPTNQKYDPFFKRCRRLVCALPGHVVEGGRCVRQT